MRLGQHARAGLSLTSRAAPVAGHRRGGRCLALAVRGATSGEKPVTPAVGLQGRVAVDRTRVLPEPAAGDGTVAGLGHRHQEEEQRVAKAVHEYSEPRAWDGH